MSKNGGGQPDGARAKKKAAKKRGRQTRYTKAIAEEILERLAEGESLNKICNSKHLPPYPTVLNWVREDRSGFANKYARAREIQCDMMFDELQELSQKALRVAKGALGRGSKRLSWRLIL